MITTCILSDVETEGKTLKQGQTGGAVDYLACAGGYLLFLIPTEAVMALDNPAAYSGKGN